MKKIEIEYKVYKNDIIHMLNIVKESIYTDFKVNKNIRLEMNTILMLSTFSNWLETYSPLFDDFNKENFLFDHEIIINNELEDNVILFDIYNPKEGKFQSVVKLTYSPINIKSAYCSTNMTIQDKALMTEQIWNRFVENERKKLALQNIFTIDELVDKFITYHEIKPTKQTDRLFYNWLNHFMLSAYQRENEFLDTLEKELDKRNILNEKIYNIIKRQKNIKREIYSEPKIK
jgi:hypothetical protein